MSQTKIILLVVYKINITFFCFIVVFNSQKIVAQNNYPLTDYYSVEYVESISSTEDVVNKSLFDKLSDLILGSSSISLVNPINVLAGNNKNLFVLDQGLLSILSISKADNIFFAYEKKNFPSLVGACFKNNNEILFTDSKLNKVFLFNISSKMHKVLNDTLGLIQPTGIAYSPVKKEIWVVETGKHSIVVLDELGNFRKRIGTRGTNEGEFNYPTSIWIDKNGKTYIVDAMNFRIQLFDADGNFLSMFGQAGDATGYFAHPKGIATDSYGNIYVADALFHTIQIFDNKGVFLLNFGKQGHGNGDFWIPSGIFIDTNNYIYIADSYNSRIQIFQLIQK